MKKLRLKSGWGRLKRCLALLALAVQISFCNIQDKKQVNPVFDSLERAETTSNDDTTSIFSPTISGWLDSNLNMTGGNKKLTLEERWKDDSLPTEPFVAGKFFLDNYSSVLRWSTDSSYILDVGSYGMIRVEDEKGNIHLETGEPDTELALLNIRKNERTRLMFVGPSSNIINARWLSSSELLVLGTFATETSQTDTLVWMIDIRDNLFRLYNLKTERKEPGKPVQ